MKTNDFSPVPQTGAANPVTAATTVSGTAGDCRWTLAGPRRNRTLTVSGEGAVKDYSRFCDIPWNTGKDRIGTLIVEQGVKSIGRNVFRNRSDLRSAVIPDSVTGIGNGAFAGCGGLTSIVIPASVTEIGEGAFSNCRSLTAISVDDANRDYSSVAGILFSRDKTKLIACPAGKKGEYCIPAQVTHIGSHAFAGCDSLTAIIIPDPVTEIGRYAFAGCAGLTSAVIPASVRSIGEGVFAGCRNLAAISVDDSCKDYASDGGVLFSRDRTVLIAFPPAAETGEYIIPASVTEIGNRAFCGCRRLTSIVIPDSVTGIGVGAFYRCSRLTSINIPRSVKNIGKYVFAAS
jgi:hypothetical protein